MPRPVGSRSREFDAKRDALLDRIAERLADPDGHRTGVRALAAAAGVSYPTLKHYFGDRDGVVNALLARRGAEGSRYLQQMATTELRFAESIEEAALMFVAAAGHRQFRAVHEIGLREGLLQPGIARTYLTEILEPTIAALEQRLAAHIARGEMRQASTRAAALMVVGPLYVAMLHQSSLAGHDLRPLDLPDFARTIATTFIKAHAVMGEA